MSCVFPALGLYFCCPLVLVWQDYYNKTPWSEELGRTFSGSSGGWNFKVKVTARSVSSEALGLGL